MKQVEKKERYIKFLELLRKILIFILISIPVIYIVILIINRRSLDTTKVIISIGCAGVQLFCTGGLIYEMELFIKTNRLSIENDKQREIVMNKLNSIKKEYVEIFPKSYEIFEKAQKIRDENGLDIRFFAKIVSCNAIQISCILFVEDHEIEFEKAILVNNFLYFNNYYLIK